METTYEFTAYNTEAIYGYGTEYEATLYLEWLNIDKETNLYEMAVSSLTDGEAEDLAINLHDTLTAGY